MVEQSLVGPAMYMGDVWCNSIDGNGLLEKMLCGIMERVGRGEGLP